MTKRTAPHHRGNHPRRAKILTDAAHQDPYQTCAKCGKTLHRCGPNGDGTYSTGRPIRWQAGHVNDGEIDGPLQIECGWCNASTGSQVRHERHTDPWW